MIKTKLIPGRKYSDIPDITKGCILLYIERYDGMDVFEYVRGPKRYEEEKGRIYLSPGFEWHQLYLHTDTRFESIKQIM